jgi:anaerobic magnesium-protoporphyrin IX monomethyl ester cyclase
VRDALHAEVDSWSELEVTADKKAQIDALWRNVDELEPVSRDVEAVGSMEIITSPPLSALVSIELSTPLERRTEEFSTR